MTNPRHEENKKGVVRSTLPVERLTSRPNQGPSWVAFGRCCHS